jgi:hypothetical protein
MAKIIKNVSGGSKTYSGQAIANNGQYEIQALEAGRFANDSALLTDIGSGAAVINNGTSDITDVALAINHLKDILLVDAAGFPLYTSTAFSSKTIGAKKLFARNTGIQIAVVQGSNTINYTATYPHAKVNGVQVINCEALDTAEMKVYDTAQGTYSGVPNALLNQFGYTLNLPKDFYQRESRFDADLYQGMKIEFTYVSLSAKTVGINILMDEVKS